MPLPFQCLLTKRLMFPTVKFSPAYRFVAALMFLVFLPCGCAAQANSATPENEKTETPKKSFDPDMTELSGREFVTSDRVLLVGSFYPGNADKETVPVILLHGQGKSREEFIPLIAEMKQRGYAILAFDFRGHGESTVRFPNPGEQGQPGNPGMMPPVMGLPPGMEPQRPPKRLPPGMGGGLPGKNNRQDNIIQPPGMPVSGMMDMPQGPAQPLRPVEYLEKNFKKEDYENMYQFDFLPFYRFLVRENNAERLNLNKLVILGIDMGGTVGGRVTKQLWGNARGKNVRSLIMISPNYDPFSKTLLKDSKCFHKDVSLLLIVGQLDQRAKENALNLRDDILGKEKRKDDEPTSMNSPVPIAEFPTERQGGELLRESRLGLPQKIADYIDETLAKSKEKDLKWRKM